jgi:hypothetical protein
LNQNQNHFGVVTVWQHLRHSGKNILWHSELYQSITSITRGYN